MAHVLAFVTNRGGAGKSSLSSQVAPALALAHPDKNVLLLDLSIQSDSSVITLGGTGEPDAFVPGLRTRGAERIAALLEQRTALGFLNAARAFNPPPQAAASAVSGWGMLRGSAAPSPTRAAASFPWREHCANVASVHQAGGSPPNLYVAPGGRPLYQCVPQDQLLSAAASLRTAFASCDSDLIVIIDTDAELSERCTSLIGLAACGDIALVLTSSWSDYQRVVDDPANGLFPGLAWLEANDPGCVAKVACLIFNQVTKNNTQPTSLANSPVPVLPFTPPKSSADSMADILEHVLSMCNDPATKYRRFFKASSDDALFADVAAFTARFVTGLATVPDTLWQECLDKGRPVVASKPSDPQKATAQQLGEVSKRLFQQG